MLEGPHAAPDFLTPEGLAAFYATAWEVHYNSARTGVRLVGPKPLWARPDGGDAGLHPSNIHDTPYALGAVDLTGDMPVILGPDGPSLGGFVCPLTVAADERWKLGQLAAGDTVALRPGAGRPDPGSHRGRMSPSVEGRATAPRRRRSWPGSSGGSAGRPDVTYRRSGDRALLVEYGEQVLDLGLRVRVQLLFERLAAAALPGVVDLTPGIRSLQVHVDGTTLTVEGALEAGRHHRRRPPVGRRGPHRRAASSTCR